MAIRNKEPQVTDAAAIAEGPERRFKVLNSKPRETIPWSAIEPHRKQAERNHYQTLERLNERGGLSWAELYMALTDQAWRAGVKVDPVRAEAAVRKILQERAA